MRLSLSHKALLVAALVGTLPVARGAAADLDYGYASAPPPIAESKVEFGSGWYVRGDIGATRLPGMDLTNPAGTGKAPTVELTNGSKLGYTASLGGGYSFNKWFRSDIVFDFHEPITLRRFGAYFPASSTYGYTNNNGTCQLGYAGYTSDGSTTVYQPYYENCTSNYQSSVSSFDILINGYIDLGHWSIFTPYVGAGVGLAFGHYSTATAFYNPDGTSYNTTFTLPGDNVTLHGYNDVRTSGNYYNFAFAAMAGIAIDIYPHTKLDIGYRYLHLGEVLGTNLAYQEGRIGLRYMIDN